MTYRSFLKGVFKEIWWPVTGPGFPRWRVEGHQPIILAIVPKKLHGIEKEFDQEVGTPPTRTANDGIFKIPLWSTWLPYFYDPQQSWGKVIFSQACVIPFTERGGCLSAYWGTTPRDQAPPWCSACWEIRSTRGRYASYWNPILFTVVVTCLCEPLTISLVTMTMVVTMVTMVVTPVISCSKWSHVPRSGN